ncbi:MAG: hypothetical protein ABW168_15355 [Sedimenticola sp.]
MAAKERLYKWRQRVKDNLRKRKLEWYSENSDTVNEQKRLKRGKEYNMSPGAIRKREARKREKERLNSEKARGIYMKNYMTEQRKKTQNEMDSSPLKEPVIKAAFTYRMDKARAVRKVQDALPTTPAKKVATLASLLQKKSLTSPTIPSLQNLNIISKEENGDIVLANALLADIKCIVSETKQKRSDNARMTMNIVSASVSGSDIYKSKSKTKLAKRLCITPRRISGGKRVRCHIMHSELMSLKFITRKTRKDAITEENRKSAHDFWILPGNSRPTGNKCDVTRLRIGPKMYASHTVYVLEQTQTEVYCDFKLNFPDIKMSQRVFERCKPFFVKPLRQKDRQTCCCRYHVEIRAVFKACMDFRQRVHRNKTLSHDEKQKYKKFDHISDLVQITLCAKNENEQFKNKCLSRSCDSCGVDDFLLMPEELANGVTAPTVRWEKYEYQVVKTKGKERRKLLLVKKETNPCELFQYFKQILQTFPAHQHRANWQNAQLKYLIDNLPDNDCVSIHDFSENYGCTAKSEIQSTYFQRTEVSVHISIIYRHAMLAHDGVNSTATDPHIVTEYFYVISPDEKHDNHFTLHAQKLISEYLKSINYSVKTMHEYTDGCQTQYKSRHCMGEIVNVKRNLGYSKLIRNYFETSHAKGIQDAAGGLLKHQADQAVFRGQVIIQSAFDLYTFANEKLQHSKSTGCKNRIFRYVQHIPRNVCKCYQSIPNNRAIHQVSSTAVPNCINVRELSCYSCDKCAEGHYESCLRSEQLGAFKQITIKLDKLQTITNEVDTDDTTDNGMYTIKDLVSKNTTVAVVAEEPEADYYVLKASGPPEVLAHQITDDWGVSYPAGLEVLKGLYYDRNPGQTLQLHIVPKKTAIVPVAAIVYICSGIRCIRNTIELTEDMHLDVLSAIDGCSM